MLHGKEFINIIFLGGITSLFNCCFRGSCTITPYSCLGIFFPYWRFPLLNYVKYLYAPILPARVKTENEQVKILPRLCLKNMIYDPNCNPRYWLLWKLHILIRKNPVVVFLLGWNCKSMSHYQEKDALWNSFLGAFFRQFNLHFINVFPISFYNSWPASRDLINNYILGNENLPALFKLTKFKLCNCIVRILRVYEGIERTCCKLKTIYSVGENKI